MKKCDHKVKGRNVNQAAGFPEREKEWQPPRLTVWEVVRDTSVLPTKTGSGPDSLGMRDVTPST